MGGKLLRLPRALLPVLLFMLTLSASADWNPGQPYKWLQAPDTSSTGIDIRVDRTSNYYRFVADDFLCTTPGPITDIHLWGSWRNDVKGRISKLHLTILADVPDPDGTGPLYSKPGERLWARDFDPSQFTERLYSQLANDAREWWWDPAEGTLLANGDQQIYQYNIRINPQDAFRQQGTAANPKIYWLAVSADIEQATPAVTEFGWKTRSLSADVSGAGHYQDDAVFGLQTTAGTSLTKLEYPSGHPFSPQSIDMAFVVTTAPCLPDLWLRTSSESAYFGDNIYSSDGASQRRNISIARGSTAVYYLRVQNDGANADTFTVTAPPAPAGWTVVYYSVTAAVDVTADVTGLLGWSTGLLAPGAVSSVLAVKVTPSLAVVPGATLTLTPAAASTTDPTCKDVGQLVTKATGMQPDMWLRTSSDVTYIGDNIYSTDGATQRKDLSVPRGSTGVYYIRVQNDGLATDTFTVKALPAPTGWTVKYIALTTAADVTADVIGAVGWSTGPLAPGANAGLCVKVTPSLSVVPGSTLLLKPTAVSTAEPTRKDVGQLATKAIGLQPDLLLRTSLEAAFYGDNYYTNDGSRQRRSLTVPCGDTALYYLRIQNDGSEADTLALKGSAAPAGWTVQYFAIESDVDVTDQVTSAAGWSTGELAAGAEVNLYVKVTPTLAVTPGASLTLTLTVNSLADLLRKDVGQLVTKATGLQPDLWLCANGDPAYIGNNIYSADGSTQTRALSVPGGVAAIYYLRVQNDGVATDSFLVTVPPAPVGWTVTYYSVSAAADVTAVVTAAGWPTGPLAVGAASGILQVRVTPNPAVPPGTSMSLLVTAKSLGNPAKIDVGKLVTTMLPSWNPGDPYKWLQAPDLTKTGMDIRIDNSDKINRVIADDFQCTSTDPITDIHFWGSWLNDVKGRIARLHLRILEDLPDTDGDGPLYSMPGKELWAKSFTAAQFTERLYRTLPKGEFEWFWDPNIGKLVQNGDTKVYLYNVLIDPREAFVQQGTKENPIVYWLAISVELEPQATTALTQFGWKTRDWNPDRVGGGHFMDDAVVRLMDVNGNAVLNPLVYPTNHPCAPKSIDMAFVLTTKQPLKVQPDGLIGDTSGASLLGNDIYNLDGSGQTVAQAVPPASTASYLGQVQNDGAVLDSFLVKAPVGPAGWTVKYFDTASNTDITNVITGSGWSIGPLLVGAAQGYRIEVTPDNTVPPGASLELAVTAASTTDTTIADAVKAITRNVPYWNPGDAYKWLQAPDQTATGMDIRIDNSDKILRAIADDFQCVNTGPITDFHFWGSWLNDAKGRIARLHVAIFEDLPDTDGAGPLYSMPGKKLWEKVFTPAQFTERLYRQLPEGTYEWWWDPFTGKLVKNGDTKIYQYNVQVNPREAFVQLGSKDKPVIYWVGLAVELEPQTTADAQFGWKTRDWNMENIGGGHFMDDAVIMLTDAIGAIKWSPLLYPIDHPRTPDSIDMSFVLTTSSQPLVYQPDGLIGDATGTAYLGNDIYNSDGASQTIGLAVPPAATAAYLGKVQNDGATTDSFLVKAPAGPAGWTVKYVDALTNADITGAMTGAGWNIGPLAVGVAQGYRIEATSDATVSAGTALELLVTAVSMSDMTKVDVVKAITTVVPDWNPGDACKWFQAPDLTKTGMDIRVDYNDKVNRVIADDFQCTSTEPITDLHFWGSWINDVKGRIARLHVTIYEDLPDTDGAGPLYSMPGKILWEKVLTPAQFTERLYRQLPDGEYEWWWDPYADTLIQNGDTKVYQYNVQIKPTEAFVQQGSPDNPVIYWLGIAVELEPQATAAAQFGWKTRDWNSANVGGGHFMDDAVRLVTNANGVTGWNPLAYPNTHPRTPDSIDMAFVLTTSQQPVKFQPDGLLSTAVGTAFIGDNIYNLDGSGQTLTQTVTPGRTTTYYGKIQNDGNVTDSFVVTATAGDSNWTIGYYDDLNNNITAAITSAAGWSVGPLAVGGETNYRIMVTPSSALTGDVTFPIVITAASQGDATKKDVVKIVNML